MPKKGARKESRFLIPAALSRPKTPTADVAKLQQEAAELWVEGNKKVPGTHTNLPVLRRRKKK